MTSPPSQDNLLEKRIRDAEDGRTISTTTKRRKVDPAEIKSNNDNKKSSSKVDPSELASAFALASLATISNGTNTETKSQQEKNDEDNKNQDSSAYETRSPKSEEVYMSIEHRSPGSPAVTNDTTSSGNDISTAPSTPEDCAISMSRKVHFAPNTKQQHVPSSPSPSSPRAGPRSPSVSRRLVVPQRALAHRHAIPMPRPHPYGGMHMNSYGPRFPPPHSPHHLQHQQHQPHHHHHHHPAARMMMASQQQQQQQHQQQQPQLPHTLYQPRAWYRAGMYPPQSLMQPQLLHPDKQWICDYCNIAAFATYEEACVHEETCKKQCASTMMMRSGGVEDERMGVESNNNNINNNNDDETTCYYRGSKSLAIPESDGEWLSELNCFVRNYCVEAFSATEDDVSRTSKRTGRIALDQVGIRCKFCADCSSSISRPKEKAVGAVSFPASIVGIYDAVKRWQRVHLEVCSAVPQDVRTKLAALANTNVWVPTTRQYWVDSAMAVGLIDTNDGIRFGKSLTDGTQAVMPRATGPPNRAIDAPQMNHNNNNNNAATPTSAAESTTTNNSNDDEYYVVFSTDREMIPAYVYFLMRQVEPCFFTEADRFVARSKGPVGYPGFQCRHCNGHAGLGKYFPVSSKSLATNSTSQNIHAHLLKCRKCPEQVKDELVQLKIEKSRSARMEPGWRKVFFDKVWERLHRKDNRS